MDQYYPATPRLGLHLSACQAARGIPSQSGAHASAHPQSSGGSRRPRGHTSLLPPCSAASSPPCAALYLFLDIHTAHLRVRSHDLTNKRVSHDSCPSSHLLCTSIDTAVAWASRHHPLFYLNRKEDVTDLPRRHQEVSAGHQQAGGLKQKSLHVHRRWRCLKRTWLGQRSCRAGGPHAGG